MSDTREWAEARLRDFIRERRSVNDGCRVLSKGDACACPLCDLDRLIATLSTEQEPVGDARCAHRWDGVRCCLGTDHDGTHRVYDGDDMVVKEWACPSTEGEPHDPTCSGDCKSIPRDTDDFVHSDDCPNKPTAPAQSESPQDGERLERVIELDRTVVARGVHGIEAALSGFQWLTTNRGSYEWDDDRWHDEFRNACEQIRERLDPLRKVAGNLKDSPQNVTGRAAAVEAYLHGDPPARPQDTALRDALEPFAKFACDPECEGPCNNCNARTALEATGGTE